MPFDESSPVEAVRKRPQMYVGSLGFFGFVQYLVCAMALLLERRPSRVAVARADGQFVMECDAALAIEELPDGRLSPFENPACEGPGLGFEGTVLNALSERLTVEIAGEPRGETLAFRRGARESHEAAAGDAGTPSTRLRFVPDASIFTVTEVSPTIFQSYLRRLSFLHPETRFSIDLGGQTREYSAGRGIVDLFDSIAAPYQLVHEPIHIVADEGRLQLEAVLAFHSWTERQVWCFVNRGRAIDGGTHEQGLHDALDRLDRAWHRTRGRKPPRNGVVGVMSIVYPDAVWEGCLKEKVGNPELRGLVRELVVRGATEWLQRRPEAAAQLRDLERFHFPDIWFMNKR